jgi:hypothetical protein
MRRSILALGLFGASALALTTVSLAATTAATPSWPSGALEKADPRVLAFYDGMCEHYADSQGLVGDARGSFVTRCRGSIPKVFPVGYDESSGGGGE